MARIAYLELTPLMPGEGAATAPKHNRLWLRGGFPRSVFAASDADSLDWRQDFMRTYLERDIPQLGPKVPAATLRRFWTMLAHNQGALFNAARIAAGLGVSGQTVGRYLDLMVDLLLVRRLAPWSNNVGKRLVRSPKVFVRDSGLVHALLGLEDLEQVLGHPVAGASWEGFVIEALIAAAPRGSEAYFYRTTGGAEIDLLLRLPRGNIWAFEIKRSLAPKLEKGFHQGAADLKPKHALVIYPGEERFPLSAGVQAIGLSEATPLCAARVYRELRLRGWSARLYDMSEPAPAPSPESTSRRPDRPDPWLAATEKSRPL